MYLPSNSALLWSPTYLKYVTLRTGLLCLACLAIVVLGMPVSFEASMILPYVLIFSCVNESYSVTGLLCVSSKPLSFLMSPSSNAFWVFSDMFVQYKLDI